MATIRRLTDSTLVITTDQAATLIEPGFHTFESGLIDLGGIGDISQVLITHEHRDHASPDFVKWLRERRRDLTVHSNQSVVDLLAKSGIEAAIANPLGVTSEDVVHEMTPTGASPPNRAFTIESVLTHPGDSYQLTASAQVLAVAMMAPWGSATATIEFVRRVRPRQVIPIHDFYLSDSGRRWVTGMMKGCMERDDIELVPLDWGDSFTV